MKLKLLILHCFLLFACIGQNYGQADPARGFLVKPSLHSGVGEQQPGKHPFAGKAFVLTDGFTFSKAADVTAVLKMQTRLFLSAKKQAADSKATLRRNRSAFEQSH